MKNKWLDRTLLVSPIRYTLVTTESMFLAEMRRLGVPRDQWPVWLNESAGATATMLEHKGQKCCIVAIRDYSGRAGVQIASLLVHEAVHLWRWIREELGEREPSSEMEAYAIQNISQSLMEEFVRQTQ